LAIGTKFSVNKPLLGNIGQKPPRQTAHTDKVTSWMCCYRCCGAFSSQPCNLKCWGNTSTAEPILAITC